jgi:hypothetical protein
MHREGAARLSMVATTEVLRFPVHLPLAETGGSGLTPRSSVRSVVNGLGFHFRVFGNFGDLVPAEPWIGNDLPSPALSPPSPNLKDLARVIPGLIPNPCL